MALRVDYQQVADIYAHAHAHGHPPVIAVANELGIKYSAAVGRVRRAREHGYLTERARPWAIAATAIISPPVVEILSPEKKREAWKLFADGEACEWCGGLHSRTCPRVRSMVVDTTNGKTVSVEFWPPGSWPEDGIIWPEDVQGVED